MSDYILELAKFRRRFPEMADPLEFGDDIIGDFWDMAQCYISPGITLKDTCYETALYLMTAHLVWSGHLIAQGQATAGFLSGASISKVSVSITPPPSGSAWSFWLGTTPYGLALRALLNIRAVGGWHVGGLPERNGFKKIGGVFF